MNDEAALVDQRQVSVKNGYPCPHAPVQDCCIKLALSEATLLPMLARWHSRYPSIALATNALPVHVQDCCVELELSDATLLLSSLRKLLRVVTGVPRLEAFVSAVCTAIFHEGTRLAITSRIRS